MITHEEHTPCSGQQCYCKFLTTCLKTVTSGLSSLGVPGMPWAPPPPYINQEGQIIPTTLLLTPPDFQTFLRPCMTCSLMLSVFGLHFLLTYIFLSTCIYVPYIFCLDCKFKKLFCLLSFDNIFWRRRIQLAAF